MYTLLLTNNPVEVNKPSSGPMPLLALMCLTAWGRVCAADEHREHAGRATRASHATAEGHRVLRAQKQLRGYM